MSRLENLLVICMSYGKPGLHTVRMLIDLCAEGATIQIIRAPAGVSLSRSITAAAAERSLAAHHYIEYVLMLDNDIWSSVKAVKRLITIEQDLAIVLGSAPSVSGLYLNRHSKNPTVAAHKLKGSQPIPCTTDSTVDAVAVHALCGLGAFLMPTQSFLAHCQESQHIYWPDKDHVIPIVCDTGPVPSTDAMPFIEGLGADSDALFWLGEDFDFCIREIKQGRHVLVAPVLFRHTSTIELDPLGPIVFPGLFGPPPDSTIDPQDERTIEKW